MSALVNGAQLVLNPPPPRSNTSEIADSHTLNGCAVHNLTGWLIILILGAMKENVLCWMGSWFGAIKEGFPEEETACYRCPGEDSVLALCGDWGAPRLVDFNGSRNPSSHARLGTEELVWVTPGRNPRRNRIDASKHCCLWACIFPDA